MKLSKLTITVIALILVVMFFSVKTWIRQGNDSPNVAESDSVQKNAPREKVTALESQPLEAGAGKGADAVTLAKAQGTPRITITLPKPIFKGTPAEIKGAFNLEPPRDGRPRDPIMVPVGCDVLLSRDCKITSSDPDPIIGELPYITDGDKEWDAYVEIGPGTQWVQIDLEQEREIHAMCVWHYHGEPRVYRDVICQISNDPDFIDGVVTVFNNDHDNSSKLGVGKDKEYIETHEGRPFAVNAVKGRYVRFYCRGNTTNEMNHYTEIEVYGKKD